MALDKLNTNSSDDLEQYRYLTGRILACVKEHEKSCKEVASTPYDGIDILLATLESSNDSQLSLNVTHSLLEILNLEKKISVLVSRGTTQIVFSAMAAAYREQPVSESLMKRLHQLLGKIGAKDRKFGVKARLSGVLPITLSLIRTNSGNFEYLLPLLQVMKIYCSNSVNSSNLGKAGGVNSMLRVVATCGKKHHTICKLAIDTLCLLTKSKSNSARALGQGGIAILLSLFYEWHRHDTRNRHIGIRKAILGVIKNITNLSEYVTKK
ncbi:putative cytosolic carboxypeptidase 1 [Apostichopus japonicus]|uniref:Putative cytosolic carboxypeptidase 1 n=1 Tax=Stichopus japonicus TaxID=307972 RepID=A0A2G8LMB3_STIJA|nr:putative cytosolic carboxypeptidase 1 [Apostichopus japonicus]